MNKHDELLKQIEESPKAGLYHWDAEHPRWIDETFVCTTGELKSLVADFRKMREKWEDDEPICSKCGQPFADGYHCSKCCRQCAALKARQSGGEAEE